MGLLLAIVLLFRKGRNARGLPDAPIASLAFYTFGIATIREGVHWLDGQPFFADFVTSLAICAALFAMGMAIWLTGFLYGQRKRRHGRIIAGSGRNLR